jgi:vitamin B12 transporter
VAVPTKNLFVWSMQNIGVVSIKGIEIQGQMQITPLNNLKVNYSANYTYQEATDITDKSSPTYNMQVAYIPYEVFSSTLSFLYKKITISGNTLFNGYRYVLGENIYENMLPSWWITDLTAQYDFSIFNKPFKLKGEINNLFNKQYEVIKSFPMPGRAFNLSIFATF